MVNNIKILVLDGQNKNALAIIRTLGSNGFEIGCVANKKYAVSFY